MSAEESTVVQAPPAPEITVEQRSALEELRNKFKDADGSGMEMNDATFLRYLRARNFNVEKASQMLENTLKWRDEFKLKELHEESWSSVIAVENSTGKMYVRGFDKHGHVLIYMKPRLENTNDHNGNIKHLVYTMERAVKCMEKTGQEKLSLVIDYDGFSLMNSPPMKTSRETLSVLQDHYPERLFRAYCIRPPYMFYGFFKVISPFIDPVTKDKICMLTTSEMNSSMNKLYQDVDRSMMEPCAGGTDERPFDSKKYLSSPFNLDYLSILNSAADGEK